MGNRASQLPDKQARNETLFLLLVLALGFIFFARNAHLQLASDDVGWLRGEAPTVFDQYRIIPRFFFVSLYALFGPSPIAALTMIFLFHAANTLMVYHLCHKLLNSQIAARVAACVFMINPITLSTLTWISCFSYVQGASLALMSLLAFWKSSETEKPLPWSIIAVFCYGVGLFCSHELLFLPVLFLLWGWFWGGGSLKRGATLFGVAMTMGTLVNFFLYDFGRYGVKTTGLFTPGFVSAFASSALSFGLSLGLAYPLSFFAKTMDFLQLCFTEPLRWGMTLVLLNGGILLFKPNRTWQLRLVLAFSFIAFITPYIIRLYLTPDSVNYDISYVLSGRVFYLPFTILALAWGGLVASVYERPVMKESKLAGFLPVLTAAAYAYALFALYTAADFMGLDVLHGSSQILPPPWNPYAGNHPAWFIGSALVVATVATLRRLGPKGRAFLPEHSDSART